MYEDKDISKPYNHEEMKEKAEADIRKEWNPPWSALPCVPANIKNVIALRIESQQHAYHDAHDPNYNTRLEPTVWMKRQSELVEKFKDAADPAQEAYRSLLGEWHKAHGTQYRKGHCPGCGEDIKDGEPAKKMLKAEVHMGLRPTFWVPIPLMKEMLTLIPQDQQEAAMKAFTKGNPEFAKAVKEKSINDVKVNRKAYDKYIKPVDKHDRLKSIAEAEDNCFKIYKCEARNEAVTALRQHHVQPPQGFCLMG